MNWTLISSLFVIYCLGACSSLELSSLPQEHPTLTEVSSFKVGLVKIDIIRGRLGEPSHTLDNPNDPNEIIWLYSFKNSKQTRASFFFRKNSLLLVKKVLFLGDGDSVSKLQKALSTFSQSKFESIRPEQTGHYLPDEIIYSDKVNGITIVTRGDKDTVETISWETPESAVASK